MEVVPYGDGEEVLFDGVAMPCYNDVSLWIGGVKLNQTNPALSNDSFF